MLLLAAPIQTSPPVPLWSGEVPSALKSKGPEKVTRRTESPVAGRPWTALTNVSQPSLTVYAPKGKRSDAAVLVYPGGGYQVLAVDLEGTEICDWLTSRGITAILVKYRVPTPKTGPYGESLQAFQDAQRAVSLVRSRAAEWRINPKKIGVIGFSAGGHLVAALSTGFGKRSYPSMDVVDKVTCRPDFAIALYPGHLFEGSSPDLRLNPHIRVTSATSPTFLLQAENDPVDDVRNSLAYYLALKNAGVPAELHVYAEGRHAFGLRPSSYPITAWPAMVERWLHTIRVLP